MIHDEAKRLVKKAETLVSKITSLEGINRDTLPVIIENLYQIGDECVEATERKENVALKIDCNIGCCYCCHTRVNVSPAEALYISHYIRSHYSLRQTDTLMKRIASILRQLKDKTEHERSIIWSRTPCVFLENDKCSIYHVRPVICRAWHSLSKDQCRRAFESENQDAEIDSTPFRGILYGTLRDMFNRICKSKGWEVTTLDIPSALRITLTHSDPFEAWFRGENLFQP